MDKNDVDGGISMEAVRWLKAPRRQRYGQSDFRFPFEMAITVMENHNIRNAMMMASYSLSILQPGMEKR